MTGQQFKAIRLGLGYEGEEGARLFALALGYTTTGQIYNLESGRRPIPPRTWRLALMFEQHGVPPHWTKTEKILD